MVKLMFKEGEKRMMLSIGIATLNRHEAMATLSLPSLLSQESKNFEVLIWDASDNDLTKNVVESYTHLFAAKSVQLRYYRAPRKGLPAQRNDLLKEAIGDIVFFIDDDSEVSADAISTLVSYFSSYNWLMGAALPVIGKMPIMPIRSYSMLNRLKHMIFPLFFGFEQKKYRKIRRSTNNIYPIPDSPGLAEWLTGAGMAYRKKVFDELLFDERLQRFGGYAWGEDYDFSHKVMLHFNMPLLILPSGFVVHHNVPGGRVDGVKRAAIIYYNSLLIRQNFNNYSPCHTLFSFIWEQRVAKTLTMLSEGLSISEIAKGYWEYRKALKEGG